MFKRLGYLGLTTSLAFAVIANTPEASFAKVSSSESVMASSSNSLFTPRSINQVLKTPDSVEVSFSGPGEVIHIPPSQEVAVGAEHACALSSEQSIKCWGAGGGGRLGNGSNLSSTTPLSVTGISNTTQISSGGFHTCALIVDGNIYCWGYGGLGQLGFGPTSNSSSPVRVSTFENAIQVAAGEFHTCAVFENKTVKCWGFGESGVLGDGFQERDNNRIVSHPINVQGIENASQVTAGDKHTCALLDDGTIKCWGEGIDGKIGDGAGITRKSPVSVAGISNAVQVSAGGSHTCAVISDKTIKCWGNGAHGKLGNGSDSSSATPVSVPGISNAVQVSAGAYETCAVLLDATIKCWGSGTYIANTVSVAGSGSFNVTKIDKGTNSSCALMEDFKIKCWGFNSVGQLGDGSTINTTAPGTDGLVIDNYKVEWSTDGSNWQSTETADSNVTITGLSVATTYQVRVAGHSSVGWGPYATTTARTSNKPGPPTALTQTARYPTSVELTWTWPADTDGLAIDNYKVEWSTGGSNWQSLETQIDPGEPWAAGLTKKSAIVTGLNVDTTYQVRVSSHSAAGWGTYVTSTARTSRPPFYPASLRQVGKNQNSIELNWNLPIDTDGLSVENYKVEWSTDGSTCLGSNWQSLETASTNATITGLDVATFYLVKVTGYSQAGWGGWSCLRVQTSFPPSSPSELTQSTIKPTSVDLTWTAPEADGLSIDNYKVEWSTDGSNWQSLETTNTEATITGLSYGASYQVRVSAYSVVGWGQPSSPVTMRTTFPPSSPSELTQSTIKPTSVDLTWTAPEADGLSIDNYKVEWSTDGSNWESIETTDTSATITGLSPGSSYQVRVSAYSLVGWGQPSSTLVAATTALPIAPIGVKQASRNANSLGISFRNRGDVSGISSSTQITAGSSHTCALLENKTVKCWGLNSNGQLGNNATTSSGIPVDVLGISNATQITAGNSHTCALLEDKSIKCWGLGSSGQLGTGVVSSTYREVTPVNSVVNISSATQVDAGGSHTCALLEDKTIKCWGLGSSGQLGTGFIVGSTYKKISPVSVAGISSATQITTGLSHTCARLEDKAIKCWGNGGLGQLGNGSIQSSATPIGVTWLSNINQMIAGSTHTCAILEDSTIRCWGQGSSGQLGDGVSTDGSFSGQVLPIEKYKVEWSTNGSSWQNLETTSKSVTLSGLVSATSYQVRVRAYSLAGYGEPSQIFYAATTGTRSMRFNFKLSDGRQLTGGAVSWALDDESYASATNYGVPSTGVLDFPRVAAGTGTITVNGLQSSTGESISFTRTVELGQAIHNVTVPVATGKGSYKINVKLPNGEPVLGASISVTGLDSYKAVEEIAYNLPSASSGSTNDQGWFQASGFVSGTPRAKVTYNDGVLVQTKFVDLTTASTNVVLDEMPWIEVNESAQTVSSGALVNVPVSLKGVSSKSGYTLSITAPSGSSQKCKGRVLSAKTNSSGKATLKVCANKSGTYKVKTKGAVSTGVVQLKVKNAAPLPVNAVTARSTSLGSATVAWSAPSYTGGASITGYKVIITGGGKTFTKTTKLRTHTFTGLKNATQYAVTVEAITKYGSSSRVTVKVGVA
jgi:alpha-tubulin suppressor-like RCC1 family protein